ncbi:hypothetical protein KEJ47_06160 [Candidatus Bathyarchaeota archaeon]|nr:hypothetical protein [Candidatus Bathyarchaeota archaeon]
MTSQTRKENWKGKGRVNVTRDERGRFVHWEPWVEYVIRKTTYGKAIAVYGVGVNRFGRQSRRYEFFGTGRDLERAVRLAYHHPPKGQFMTLSARDFISNPSRYGSEGYWLDFKVDS